MQYICKNIVSLGKWITIVSVSFFGDTLIIYLIFICRFMISWWDQHSKDLDIVNMSNMVMTMFWKCIEISFLILKISNFPKDESYFNGRYAVLATLCWLINNKSYTWVPQKSLGKRNILLSKFTCKTCGEKGMRRWNKNY